MKQWGLLGLLALAACAGEDSSGDVSEARECPDVVAGSLPVESPAAELAQRIWSSQPQRPQVDDGRQSVIVRFQPDVVVGAALVERAGGQVGHTFRGVPALAARLSPSELAALRANPDVVDIEPDVEWHALGTASSSVPGPVAQGSAGEYTDGVRLVEATRVWDANGDGALDPGAPTGDGIKVCVIDSGIDPGHPELAPRIIGGKDFVDGDDDPSDRQGDVWGEGHGTHVAGSIAAQLGSPGTVEPSMDRGGVTGVAPGAQLLIARVLNLDGRAKLSSVMAAVEWCHAQGARIASMSLGGGDWGKTARDVFQRVHDEGMLVIAAAGNDGGPLLYPAAFPSVLAVGAVDSRQSLAKFSSRGSNLSLVAPGVDVLSTFIRERGRYSHLEVAGARYASRALVFAPSQDVSGELVDCGYGTSRASCRGGSCSGFVAYVDLGGARLESVVTNVMKQGARAIIFGHPEVGGEPETLILGPGNWVPGAMVGNTSAVLLRTQLGQSARVDVSRVDYTRFSGTSMAAPHVSGVAALLWSERPSLTAAQVRGLLERTAKDLGKAGWDTEHGHGLVQASAALEELRRTP
jgi:subtilisin family serine protease